MSLSGCVVLMVCHVYTERSREGKCTRQPTFHTSVPSHLSPLQRIPAPSVPYMGPYLNQLITIEVGMSTFVKDPPEHVNFSKLERVCDIRNCGLTPFIKGPTHTFSTACIRHRRCD